MSNLDMPLMGLFAQTALLTSNVGYSPHHPAFRVRAETLSPTPQRPPFKCSAPVPLTDLLQIRGSHNPILKSSNLLVGSTELWETHSCCWFLLKDTAGKQMGERHKAGVWGGCLEPPA